MKKILIAVSALLLSSCISVEKAEKVMRANPVELAKLCADCFPVKVSEVKIDSIFIKGKTTVRTDTVQADCPDGTKVKVKCPECKLVTPDTIRINNVTKIRDTAFEEVLKNERDDYKNKYANMEQSRDAWRKWCLWLGGILLLLCIGLFLKFYLRS